MRVTATRRPDDASAASESAHCASEGVICWVELQQACAPAWCLSWSVWSDCRTAQCTMWPTKLKISPFDYDGKYKSFIHSFYQTAHQIGSLRFGASNRFHANEESNELKPNAVCVSQLLWPPWRLISSQVKTQCRAVV